MSGVPEYRLPPPCPSGLDLVLQRSCCYCGRASLFRCIHSLCFWATSPGAVETIGDQGRSDLSHAYMLALVARTTAGCSESGCRPTHRAPHVQSAGDVRSRENHPVRRTDEQGSCLGPLSESDHVV